MKKEIVFIFVFTGEFGYELLNWQGRIRNFSLQHPESIIYVASKSECEVLYRDFATHFISISELQEYRDSYADRYFSHSKKYIYKRAISEIYDEIWAIRFRQKLRKYIKLNLKRKLVPATKMKFIFSDLSTSLYKMQFGAARTRFSRLKSGAPDGIYEDIPYSENRYINFQNSVTKSKQIEALKSVKSTKPIAVVQTASRNRVIRSTDNINEQELLLELSKEWEIVLLEYESQRFSDTQGRFGQSEYHSITFKNLEEQMNVLSQADICISFTHGDFRSNTYVPALIGKQSIVVTSKKLMENSAVETWNEHVFSGEIIPIIFSSNEATRLAIKQIKNA